MHILDISSGNCEGAGGVTETVDQAEVRAELRICEWFKCDLFKVQWAYLSNSTYLGLSHIPNISGKSHSALSCLLLQPTTASSLCRSDNVPSQTYLHVFTQTYEHNNAALTGVLYSTGGVTDTAPTPVLSQVLLSVWVLVPCGILSGKLWKKIKSPPPMTSALLSGTAGLSQQFFKEW